MNDNPHFMRSNVCDRRKWVQMGQKVWYQSDTGGIHLEHLGWNPCVICLQLALWR